MLNALAQAVIGPASQAKSVQDSMSSAISTLFEAPDKATPTATKVSPSAGDFFRLAGSVVPGASMLGNIGGAVADVNKEVGLEKPTEVKSDITVGQALGVDIGKQALGLIGGLQGIKADEQAALNQLQAETGLAMENIRNDSNLRALAQGAARTRQLVAQMEELERQRDTGGIQRQIFN